MERQRAIQGGLCVSPFVVGSLFFFAGPMLVAGYISLNNWPVPVVLIPSDKLRVRLAFA